ncbi:MAG: hypothetical protein HUJ26_16985 [Planctomycetaceae bacterium]|nr:hypothetical protein [Planctomycetaceae bacterium]
MLTQARAWHPANIGMRPQHQMYVFRHDHPCPQIEWMLRSRKTDGIDHPLTTSVFTQQRQPTKTGEREKVSFAVTVVDFSGFSMTGIHEVDDIMPDRERHADASESMAPGKLKTIKFGFTADAYTLKEYRIIE